MPRVGEDLLRDFLFELLDDDGGWVVEIFTIVRELEAFFNFFNASAIKLLVLVSEFLGVILTTLFKGDRRGFLEAFSTESAQLVAYRS